MKFDTPKNSNYAAVVSTVRSITPLEGCQNIQGIPFFGFQAITGLDTKVGDLGVVFPAECQLSDEFCKTNNLYRHTELNLNPDASGYLEDNRRVRAIKLRGHRSDCLFMPLSSLSYTGVDTSQLRDGDSFDTLNSHELCKKYVVKTKANISRNQRNKEKAWSRVDKKYFPEHFDSEQYFRNAHTIPQDATIIITQKIHGTSIRSGNTLVARKLNRREKLAKFFGVAVSTTEYAHLAGSRKVIKDPNNPNQQHYYAAGNSGLDIWTKESQKLNGIIPEGFIVYGELVGWTEDGSPIQQGYTYNIPKNECELYVYRISFINPQGKAIDLVWDQVVEFCRDLGLKTVPELWRGLHKDFIAEDWIDTRFHENGYSHALSLGDNKKLVDEGVCIRLDSLAVAIFKHKSPIFLGHETKLLDKEVVDMETIGSEDES